MSHMFKILFGVLVAFLSGVVYAQNHKYENAPPKSVRSKVSGVSFPDYNPADPMDELRREMNAYALRKNKEVTDAIRNGGGADIESQSDARGFIRQAAKNKVKYGDYKMHEALRRSGVTSEREALDKAREIADEELFKVATASFWEKVNSRANSGQESAWSRKPASERKKYFEGYMARYGFDPKDPKDAKLGEKLPENIKGWLK